MRTKLGISPENIILYGQSIGTVPTVDLASRFEVDKSLSSTSVFLCLIGWGGDPSQSADVRDARRLPSNQKDLVLRCIPQVPIARNLIEKSFEVDFILFQH